ncbi:response regulator transcription factor [Shewanella sp. MBTL60-007]|uniref:response regulator transcription factor n=1 Tax=Shewanella sp. MBTL60-007 TaxID=2815911 RepID=UPI001BC40DA5|nr:helix-turn-helix transcriptional regulator [Shewanella sp. MBTL60-007]GIU33130.1 helix-turn-helix transcriptional regulator [Shewanella sp. MBTL60-007]
MINDSFKFQVSKSISALNSSSFTPKVIDSIGSIFSFDCVVMLGCEGGKRPIYLYDSIENERELLFLRYLTASYKYDPFYKQLNLYKQQGVFTLEDVVKKTLDYKVYCKEFYKKTGWKDELCVVVEVQPDRWVMLCFGYLREGNGFTKQQVIDVKSCFSIVQSLCQQHWKVSEFNLLGPLFNLDITSYSIRGLMGQTLSTFGKELLTVREQEVVGLIIQGLDNKGISKALGIVEGTVKNHRKKIYKQFGISSLSELFQLFFEHMNMLLKVKTIP